MLQTKTSLVPRTTWRRVCKFARNWKSLKSEWLYCQTIRLNWSLIVSTSCWFFKLHTGTSRCLQSQWKRNYLVLLHSPRQRKSGVPRKATPLKVHLWKLRYIFELDAVATVSGSHFTGCSNVSVAVCRFASRAQRASLRQSKQTVSKRRLSPAKNPKQPASGRRRERSERNNTNWFRDRDCLPNTNNLPNTHLKNPQYIHLI